MTTREIYPEKRRLTILKWIVGYSVAVVIVYFWIGWLTPEKPHLPVLVSRPVVVSAIGYLKEDTALISYMTNNLAIEGDVTKDYRKGNFISFPTLKLNEPWVSQGAWRIESVSYVKKDKLAFLVNRGDVTVLSVDDTLPGGIDNIPVRLWEKNPTIELE